MSEAAAAGVRPKGPKAISRVLDLLALLSNHPEGLSLADLSTMLSVPKPTFLDTLRGLADLSYLIHEEGRYRLGPAAYKLASRILTNWSAPDAIRHCLKTLAQESQESVGFAVADWEYGQAIYTEAINSLQPVRYAMQAGLRAPLYASAAGRVLLAHASPARVSKYLDHAHLKALTSATRTNHEQILDHLAEIKARGYCASFGEMLSDTAAIAVPVFSPDGKNIGAIMLAAPLDRMRMHFDRMLAAILTAGQRVSGTVGSTGQEASLHILPERAGRSSDG